MSIAFVFPGQGSQSVGMLDSIANERTVADMMHDADVMLGMPLCRMIHDGPKETLSITTNTQPAILLTSVALYRLYREMGGAAPEFLAGHSLGEYSALVVAGSIPFTQAVKTVRARAELMQSIASQGHGGMAAILGLDCDVVQRICEQTGCEISNFNSSGQTVISGWKKDLDLACELVTRENGRGIRLMVSTPSHSSFMKPIAEPLKNLLANIVIDKPRISVLSNVDMTEHCGGDDTMEKLVKQVYCPVQWVKTIERMHELGVTHVVEFGPGHVLTNLIRRIDRDMDARSVSTLDELKTLLQEPLFQSKDQ